jgi:bifunctional DNase/RNase
MAPPARSTTLLVSAVLLLAACDRAPNAGDNREVPVEVGFVAVDPRAGAPVVLLEESGGNRNLPIWIGFAEAHSIASEMEHLHPLRPNTHDLAKSVIDHLDGAVERIVVTELREGTYYALLVVRAHGQRMEIDARPSDAIALALRYGAPIFVRESLFDSAGSVPPPDESDERST